MSLHLLDTQNLLRAVNPQTDTELALYERLYELNWHNELYVEAFDNFNELTSIPTLCLFHLEAVFDEKEALEKELEDIKKTLDRIGLSHDADELFEELDDWLVETACYKDEHDELEMLRERYASETLSI